MPTLHWLTRDADIHTASPRSHRLLKEAPTLSGNTKPATR